MSETQYKTISSVPEDQEFMDIGRWAFGLQQDGYKIIRASSGGEQVEGLKISRDSLSDDEAIQVGRHIHKLWMSGTHVAFMKDGNFRAFRLASEGVS